MILYKEWLIISTRSHMETFRPRYIRKVTTVCCTVSASSVCSHEPLALDTLLEPVFCKGLLWLALTDPQGFFLRHLTKKEQQPSYWKRYSVYFGEVLTIAWLSS